MKKSLYCPNENCLHLMDYNIENNNLEIPNEVIELNTYPDKIRFSCKTLEDLDTECSYIYLLNKKQYK